MKATTRIDVTVEIEKEDAARIYNMVIGWKAETDRDHQTNGEALRAELQGLVNRAVRAGIGAYESAKM